MDDRDKGNAPPRVEVTGRFLADVAARQLAYETRRRMWTATFQPSDPRAQAVVRSRNRGAIHDPRQAKFDL